MSSLMLIAILIGFMMVSVLAMILLHVVIDEEKMARRFARAVGQSMTTNADDTIPFYQRVIAGLGFTIARSGILPARTLRDLRHTLRIAGFRRDNTVGLFVGTKILLLVTLPALMFLAELPFHLSRLAAVSLLITAAIAGLLSADTTIKYRRSRFIKQLETGIADALDMMVICADAGLSMEAGMMRVATEIKAANHAVAEEIHTTATEMRIGSDMREALLGLGMRTGLDSLKRLSTTLVQTIQYGTPLTQALRTLSAELRQEQLTRFEERAARLPVLLTVPMITFILPCEFIIVGGPAILHVMQMFAH